MKADREFSEDDHRNFNREGACTTNYAVIMVEDVVAGVLVLIVLAVAQRYTTAGVSRRGLKG